MAQVRHQLPQPEGPRWRFLAQIDSIDELTELRAGYADDVSDFVCEATTFAVPIDGG